MGIVTSHLRGEHEAIQTALQNLQMTMDVSSSRSQLQRLDNMLIVHHQFEEIYLFKDLFESGRVSEGGPNCTLFFGLYLNANPYLQELLKESQFDANLEAEPVKTFFNQKSFLSIPIEEHRATHFLMVKLKMCLDLNDTIGYKKYLARYTEILKTHIRKEDECLFRMADTLLSEEKQKNLYEKFIAPKLDASYRNLFILK